MIDVQVAYEINILIRTDNTLALKHMLALMQESLVGSNTGMFVHKDAHLWQFVYKCAEPVGYFSCSQ